MKLNCRTVLICKACKKSISYPEEAYFTYDEQIFHKPEFKIGPLIIFKGWNGIIKNMDGPFHKWCGKKGKLIKYSDRNEILKKGGK